MQPDQVVREGSHILIQIISVNICYYTRLSEWSFLKG